MTPQEIITTLGGLFGFAAIFKSIIDSVLKKREKIQDAAHEFREVRYKALILLMMAMIDFEKEKVQLQKHGRNFENKEQLLDEIKDEWNNMILFASDDVIKSIKSFIQNPVEQRFHVAALAMRKDLYKLYSKLQVADLKL